MERPKYQSRAWKWGAVLLALLTTLLFAGAALAGSGGRSTVPQVAAGSRTLTGASRAGVHAPRPGGRIAFTSDRDGNNEIYVMNVDSSNQTRLTNNPANDYDPYWSPDGTKLVFTRLAGNNYDIYMMNADGSNPVNLTNSPAFDAGASWSPDGSRILFTSDRGGSWEVYRMDMTGANVTQLSNTPGLNEVYPVYSPDQSRIAYAARDPSNNNLADVYVMLADGTGQTNITNSPTWDDFHPAWSPDGARIAFTTDRDGNQEVYTVAPDGSTTTNLTNNPANDGFGNWSPDGMQFVFHSDRLGPEEIYTMNADGSNQTRLTNNPTLDVRPAWGVAAPAATATATSAPPSTTPTARPATSTPPAPTATATPPAPTVTACAVQFTDVDQSNPFYPFIRCLACRQIVSGYGDGTFRWGNDVTRGQLAKIIANAASFSDPIPTTQQTFADVPPSNAFWLFIERLAGHGAISGYACGGPGEPCIPPGNQPYFRWGAPATRGQIAKINTLAAKLGGPLPSTAQTFTDVPSSNPFWLWIEQLAGRGVISGYACGGPGEPCDGQNRPYFRWGANATRGQMAKIAANTFSANCQTPARR